MPFSSMSEMHVISGTPLSGVEPTRPSKNTGIAIVYCCAPLFVPYPAEAPVVTLFPKILSRDTRLPGPSLCLHNKRHSCERLSTTLGFSLHTPTRELSLKRSSSHTLELLLSFSGTRSILFSFTLLPLLSFLLLMLLLLCPVTVHFMPALLV